MICSPGSAVSVSGVLRCARDTGKARGTCVPRAFGEVWLRRCATLPCPLGHSTIAVPGLSFRVRNGTGRLPWAMAAAEQKAARKETADTAADANTVFESGQA